MVVASIGEAVVVVFIDEVVVVSIGEAVVAVVTGIGEESISKLTLNRRLLIRVRTPEKLALFTVLLMSILDTEVLETINPGDVTVPDSYRILSRLPLAGAVTNPMAKSLWMVKDTARVTVLQQVLDIVGHTILSSLSV